VQPNAKPLFYQRLQILKLAGVVGLQIRWLAKMILGLILALQVHRNALARASIANSPFLLRPWLTLKVHEVLDCFDLVEGSEAFTLQSNS
jgi:hypothetical protein